MSEFNKFTSLPKEIQFHIWALAAREPIRILRLDALFLCDFGWVSLGDSEPPNLAKEFAIYAGRFQGTPEAPRPPNLVYPSSSCINIRNLSLTCRDARKIVLEEYPDTIFVEEPRQPTDMPEGLRIPLAWPVYRIRCNFETDIFWFDRLQSSKLVSTNDLEHARNMWIIGDYLKNDYELSVLFREDLKRRIKNIGISEGWGYLKNLWGSQYFRITPWMTGPGPRPPRHFHDVVECILSGAPNLANLFIIPDDLTQTAPLTKHSLPSQAWEGQFPPGTPTWAREQILQMRMAFHRIVYRLFSPACRNMDLEELCQVGNEAVAGLEVLGSNKEERIGVLSRAVEGMGFDDTLPLLRTVRVLPRDTKSLPAEGEEVVWLPRPGYISHF